MLYLAACCLLLSACLPDPGTAEILPTTTPTITITPTPTATIIWFPPTATYTPFPTQEPEPTVDLRPVFGKILLEDPFTDKTMWQTQRSEAGAVAYGKSELTLAVAQSKGTLSSLRKTPQLDNYYLEIDALPSLCRGADMYGVLVRAESNQDHYRVVANCEGELRVDRVKNGRTTPLQDWVHSGQILPGGILRTRLGIWAVGQELRVFVNSVYQFSVKDPVLKTGVVGVYARAAGDTPLTVSFSNLVVYDVGSTGSAQPALTPTRAPSSP